MTRRERVRAAIEHRDTDIVPYSISFTQPAYHRLLEYVGDEHYLETIGEHLTGCGLDSFTEVKPGYFQDHFGVIWNKTVDKDIGMVDNQLLPEASLSGYSLPEIDETLLRQRCEYALANAGDRFVSASLGFSLFERAWTLRGMQNLLLDFASEPNFVHQLFELLGDYNLRVIDIYSEYPFDAIYFGDDWGQQQGTIMGPTHWRTYIKPTLARMYAAAKKTGKFVIQHSCGDIREILPDLIDIGLDVYNTFQPEIYDIAAVKREFGSHLTFYGGISTQRLLPFATPEKVKAVAKQTMDIMSRGGGYIASPTHAVPGDVPPENIVALIDLFKNQ